MRICFISHGGFVHVHPYLHYFKGAGYDVHLVSLAPSPELGVQAIMWWLLLNITKKKLWTG